MGGRGRFTPGTTEQQLLNRWNRELDRQLSEKKYKEKPKMAAPDLSNYVDVATRVKLLLEKYPNASIMCSTPKVVEIAGHTFIEVTATIETTPTALQTMSEHTRRAIATAWEPFPGKTPYTRDSEMMNAETSAVGRAAGLLGFGLTGSLASANEVANRQGTTTTVVNNTTITQAGNPPSDKQLWLYKKLLKDQGKLPPVNIDQMDKFQVSKAIEALKAGEEPAPDFPVDYVDEEPF